jgi:aryl-alcohol dehydrogenase-like predicted oxidoreductase
VPSFLSYLSYLPNNSNLFSIPLTIFFINDRYAPVFGMSKYDPSKIRPNFTDFEESVRAIGALISEGKIRHWGLSNETTFGVVQFCETAKRLVSRHVLLLFLSQVTQSGMIRRFLPL